MVNAFLLALAVTVAAGGRLGDMFGRRRMFVLGATMFVGFSALCGAAPSEEILIFARFGEGIGGALMMPATQAIVTTVFGPEERGKALGILVGIASVFLSAGPLLGGADHRGHQLALDLLREPPDRDRGRGHGAALRAGEQGAGRSRSTSPAS